MKFSPCIAVGGIGQGCQWVCRHVVETLLYMHGDFPTLKKKQMIMTSLHDVTVISLM